jgi:hypothetical protein
MTTTGAKPPAVFHNEQVVKDARRPGRVFHQPEPTHPSRAWVRALTVRCVEHDTAPGAPCWGNPVGVCGSRIASGLTARPPALPATDTAERTAPGTHAPPTRKRAEAAPSRRAGAPR